MALIDAQLDRFRILPSTGMLWHSRLQQHAADCVAASNNIRHLREIGSVHAALRTVVM